MDIEQLKLVLEALQSVSHDASTIAVLWLWLKFGAVAVSHATWMIVILVVAWIVGSAILRATGASGSDEFLKDMRRTLNTGTPGLLTDNERRATMAKLTELAETYAQEKRKSM